MFGIGTLEYNIVSFRNWVHFLCTGGDYESKKYFVIGHPRTGTKSIHHVLEENNIASLHSPGMWPTKEFDAFSDRGYYQPIKSFVQRYPNSLYLLNTRSCVGFIRSWMIHKQVKSATLTESMVRDQIIRRNQFFIEMVKLVPASGNDLIIFDIQKPGAFSWLCRRLDFNDVDVASKREKRPELSVENAKILTKVFDDLGIENAEENFVLSEITSSEDMGQVQRFLDEHKNDVYI